MEKLGLIKKCINQYKIWKPSVATKNIIYFFRTREKRTSYGDLNPDKTVYIIRSLDDKSFFYTGPVHNLLANYFYVVSHILYAKQMKWIPVVDQKNYPVYNLLDYEVDNSDNPWEYYWNQPAGISLKEAYQSKNVVLSKRSWFTEYDLGYNLSSYDVKSIEMYSEVLKTIELKPYMTEKINSVAQELFGNKERILGVAFRFAGHAKDSKYPGAGHPESLDIDTYIDVIKKYKEKWNMNYIFLTSDESESVSVLRREFGDSLIVYNRNRSSGTVGFNSMGALNPMYHKSRIEDTTREYLVEMELLSKCDCLLGTITSGFRYALIKGFSNNKLFEIIDNGTLPDNRKR